MITLKDSEQDTDCKHDRPTHRRPNKPTCITVISGVCTHSSSQILYINKHLLSTVLSMHGSSSPCTEV